MDYVPFMSNVRLAKKYLQRFAEGVVPFSQVELDQLCWLDPAERPSIWRPFSLKQRQNGRHPHTFIYEWKQVNLGVYPCWHLQDFWWYGIPDGIEETDLTYDAFHAITRRRRFVQIREWLGAFPIATDERIYVANPVERDLETLVMPWHVFLSHWEVLIWGTANIVSEDPHWYLVFFNFGPALFGHSLEFAAEHKVAWHQSWGLEKEFVQELLVASCSFGLTERTQFLEETLSLYRQGLC